MTLPRISLGDWLSRWLTAYAPLRCGLKTLERYGELANYVTRGITRELETISRTPLPELHQADIEMALVSILRSNANPDGVSAQTVRHVASMLRAALNKAWRLDMLVANPIAKVELPRIDPKDTRSLDIEEIAQLQHTCRNDWTFELVDLGLGSGCRRGELLALEWTDLNRNTGTASICRSLEQTRAGLRIKLTKNRTRRTFTLPDTVFATLARYRARVPESRLIFPDPDGGYRKPNTVSSTMCTRMRQARIPNASLHTLRHTHATHLLSAGVPLKVVSERLGHSDPGFTARVYAHVLAADDRRAANAWDKLIAEARSIDIERKPPQRAEAAASTLSSTA